MEGAPGTLYEGEKFQLLFKFSSRYPFDSPQVMFTGENIPVHPHVYSNGHICLSILTEDWSPALSVQSVCLSIISMLSSCKEKILCLMEKGGKDQKEKPCELNLEYPFKVSKSSLCFWPSSHSCLRVSVLSFLLERF
eukprot:XP_028356034.1 ubiquitin-conjugating enzyme E2 W isoform X3 [Physeter catodon]